MQESVGQRHENNCVGLDSCPSPWYNTTMNANDASALISAAATEAGLTVSFSERPAHAVCFIIYLATADNSLKVAGLRYRAKKMQAVLNKAGLSLGRFEDNSGYNHPVVLTRVWFG